ncbi:alkane 1-monooxygenase [Cryomorphaceae bacterium]|nr:alkane 1-monooxygenase [Cryomorphaceae bacterium]
MKHFGALKYLPVFVLPVLTWYSFNIHGWATFLPFVYVFGFIPLLELFLPADATNFSTNEEKSRLDNLLYDALVYLTLPVQLFTLGYFLFSLQEVGLAPLDIAGRVLSMGLCCGILGINVGHELGHRRKRYETWMAKINLMTSLNMHFMHEHNIHHHSAVSTPEDPASARYGEPVFAFWIRSITGVYAMAWRLEAQRLRRNGHRFLSFHNQMITDHLIEGALLLFIGLYFGLPTLGYFLIAALLGHLLLETVNYVEHYGLVRKKKGNRYETVTPQHSWNSDHVVGRIHLFELSRHSDHHFRAGRKYQILRHMDESPQMPTGYPGMMILSFFPPLWFAIMNPRVRGIQAQQELPLSA